METSFTYDLMKLYVGKILDFNFLLFDMSPQQSVFTHFYH